MGYGLHHNIWVDDRQDPEKSTRAAAHHLKDLYNQFGDWYLAMAAYNSGPGTVQAAVKRTGYADFWELYRRNVLPKETRNYVPIILAVTIMAKNPSHAGVFAEQIVAVTIAATKGGAAQSIERDEQLRPETTLEALAKLKPVVRAGGTVTAGNASTINDGAAALLLASGAAVEKYGLKARARVLGFASAGVAPRIMGVGPIPAVEKLAARLRLKVSDFDVIELNEAFASQALACLRALGLADDAEHVNANGGAIALGHPLGMSGARIAGAAVQELLRRSGRYGLATMCVGVGQGAALAFERV